MPNRYDNRGRPGYKTWPVPKPRREAGLGQNHLMATFRQLEGWSCDLSVPAWDGWPHLVSRERIRWQDTHRAHVRFSKTLREPTTQVRPTHRELDFWKSGPLSTSGNWSWGSTSWAPSNIDCLFQRFKRSRRNASGRSTCHGEKVDKNAEGSGDGISGQGARIPRT